MSDLAIPQFYQVVEAYYAELRAYAARKLGNRTTAEDIVQEACLRLSSLQGEVIENPRAYLYRIVGNLVIDHRRKERFREHELSVLDRDAETADPAADAERQLIGKQRVALLSKAIAELPPRCRECFILRRFDDLPQDEIARRMGISRSMVEKHLRLAIMHCAKRVREGD